MIVKVKDLTRLLSILNAVPPYAGISSSLYTRLSLRKGRLHLAMASTAFGEVHVDVQDGGADWTFYADRRMLQSFVSVHRGAGERDITIDLLPDGQLRLRCGRHRVTLSPITAICGYGECSDLKGRRIKFTAHQNAAFGMMATYAAATPAADHLSRIQLVSGYGLLASDGFFLCLFKDKRLQTTVPLPAMLPNIMKGMPEADMLINRTGVVLRLDCGQIFVPTGAGTKKFPLEKFRTIASKAAKCPTTFQSSSKSLIGLLTRLKSYVFYDEGAAVVQVVGKKEDKVLSIRLTAVQGEVQEKLRQPPLQDVDVRWSLARLLPWLDFIHSQDEKAKVEFAVHPDHFLIFRGRAGGHKVLLVQAEIAK